MKHRIFKFSACWHGLCHRCCEVVSSPLWRYVLYKLEKHVHEFHTSPTPGPEEA